MENKYTDDEWIEVRKRLALPALYVKILDYHNMFAVPSLHQRIFRDKLIEYANRNKLHSFTGDHARSLTTLLFGELETSPLFINLYPGIVAWRLENGK